VEHIFDVTSHIYIDS